MNFLYEQIEEVIRLTPVGTQATLKKGFATTKSNRGNQPEAWVRSDTTIILGCHPSGSEMETQPSIADWKFEVSPSLLARATETAIVIGCERIHGGLHSGRYGATAQIHVNEHVVDLIPLVVMPEGHNDYFHREVHPELSTIPLLRNCNTIYRFGVPISFLRETTPVVVSITVDPGVKWDIDYMTLIIICSRKRLHSRVQAIFAATGGFIASQILDALVPDGIWKSLFEHLRSLLP